jgi:hypothetical protein
MARNFVRASSQWILTGSPSLSSQMSISAWVKQTTTQSGGYPNGYQIICRQINGAPTEINYAFFLRDGINLQWTTATSTYVGFVVGITNDTNWHHYAVAIDWAAGTYSISQDQTVTTGSFTPSTPQTSASYVTNIARLGGTLSNEYMNGQIAELAIWNTKISDDEIKSLADKFRPPSVRPQSLVCYWPLVRDLKEIRAGNTMTDNGTTVAVHPPIYAA